MVAHIDIVNSHVVVSMADEVDTSCPLALRESAEREGKNIF